MMKILLLLLFTAICAAAFTALDQLAIGEKLRGFKLSAFFVRLAVPSGFACAGAILYYILRKRGPSAWSVVFFCLLLLMVVALNALGVLLFVWKNRSQNPQTFLRPSAKLLRGLTLILLIAVVLEATVFNFRFFTSLGYEPVEGYQASHHTERDVNGKLTAVTEITGIQAELKNIRVRVVEKTKRRVSYNIKTYATDEANELYFALPDRQVNMSVPRTQYMNMHLSGKSEKLRVEVFNVSEGTTVEVQFNQRVPLVLSAKRMEVVFLLLAALFLFRPGSVLYRRKMDMRKGWQIAFVTAFIALQIASLTGLSTQNQFILQLEGSSFSQHTQYQDLAHSLKEGRLDLDYEVDDTLKSLENPYDKGARNAAYREEGKISRWDNAYFNGKFYVYFGILPELTFYLPYYLATGNDFHTLWGIIATGAFVVLGIVLLLAELVRRHFPKTSIGVFLLLCAAMVNGCGLLYAVSSPDFYTLPILMAVALALFGLYFWISSRGSGGKLIKWRVAAGSICIALIAASRPQVLLAGLLAVPLFWRSVFQERTLLSKKSIGATLCMVIPFAVVAAGLMYYNAARFGSPFDFGANYNLTTNDMTKRGFVAGRIPLGVFTYLFQPPAVNAVFPFATTISFATNYMGCTIREQLYGGLFATNLVVCAVFLLRRVRNVLKAKKLYGVAVAAILAGAVIMIADTQMAGILQRYMADFSWLFFLAAALVVLAGFEQIGDNPWKRRLIGITAFACIAGVIYNGLVYFDWLSISDPGNVLFQEMGSLVQFWL